MRQWLSPSPSDAPASTANACGGLPSAATREPREIERGHLLGLAAMYQRIADDLASEKSDEIQSAEAVRLKA